MTKRTCTEDGCGRPHFARGFCKMHWKRWRDDVGHPVRVIAPLSERFWGRVDVRGPDDCWLWTGLATHKGYGKMKVDGRTRPAHRLSYEMATGVDPADLFVCHHCDVRLCVNPAHLFLGTHLDNMADMRAKGRSLVGRSLVGRSLVGRSLAGRCNATRKLTEAQVREIRVLLRSGMRQVDIGQRYGVCQATIMAINTGRTWRGVG